MWTAISRMVFSLFSVGKNVHEVNFYTIWNILTKGRSGRLTDKRKNQNTFKANGLPVDNFR
jgi:hypothetical protein